MNIVYECEEDNSEGIVYYYAVNRTHNSNGEIYVYNAHGDTVQLVKDGAVTVAYTYDAFGNLIEQVGESDNPLLYCGEYFDAETGTYYLRARYYNPASGRFTQQDAWAFMDASDPLSLNLYTYCCNNPVMYVDPSGCKDIPLRETVERANGAVVWDSKTKTATITVNGKTVSFSENSKSGAYIGNDGKMYVPEQLYNKAVYNATGQIEQQGNITVKGFYNEGDGPQINLPAFSASVSGNGNATVEKQPMGITLLDKEYGMVTIEYDNGKVGGEVNICTAKISGGLSTRKIGAEVKVSAVGGAITYHLFGENGIDVTVEGYFLGGGAEFSLTSKGFKLGYGAVVGGSIEFSLR